jgi:MFS family permease
MFGLLSFALLMVIAPSTDQTVAVFVALGLAGGIAAGPIMSMPSAVLSPGTRARGMGVFFTLFYLGVVAAPLIAGWMAEVSGHAGVAFTFGAFMLMVACLVLMIFRRVEGHLSATAPTPT